MAYVEGVLNRGEGGSLPGSRFLGCHVTLPGERCVTAQKTAAAIKKDGERKNVR